MKTLKYLLFNISITAFIYGATIWEHPYSEYLANLVPFLVLLLVLLSVLFNVVILGAIAFEDEMDDKTIYKAADVGQTGKTKMWINFIIDIILSIWLVAFGFLWSGIFYFSHYLLTQVGLLFKNEMVKRMNKKAESL